MHQEKPFELARFLRVLLDFLFGLAIFACFGLVVWVGVSPLALRTGEGVGSASIPVRIGSGTEPQYAVSFVESPEPLVQAAAVREAEGTLYLETKSVALIAIANAAKFVILLGLVYVFDLLRGVVRAIESHAPFTIDTSRKVRRLGYVVLLLTFVAPVVEYLAAREIVSRIPPTVPNLVPGPTFDARILLISLMILLLAHVWSYGLDLERERALTV